jgi:proteasome lid subunit RPN8/RPN11
MLKILSHVISEIYSHAEETYPEECCGFLSSSSIGGIVTKAFKCNNIQDKLHQVDPRNYPNPAHKAYIIDPSDMLPILDRDSLDYFLSGIYHSHNGNVSFFSEKDRKGAITDNKPMWPKFHYLVVSVIHGKVHHAKVFRWNTPKRDFTEEPIEIVEKLYKILKDGTFIKSEIPGTYAAYSREKIFGRLDCKSGMKMKKENRVFFHSLEDAVREGYRPCKKCKPLSVEEFEQIRYLIPQYDTIEEFYNCDFKK